VELDTNAKLVAGGGDLLDVASDAAALRAVLVKFWPRGGFRGLPSMRGGTTFTLSLSCPRFGRVVAADGLDFFFCGRETVEVLAALRFFFEPVEVLAASRLPMVDT
jgi:hypothetical protein